MVFARSSRLLIVLMCLRLRSVAKFYSNNRERLLVRRCSDVAFGGTESGISELGLPGVSRIALKLCFRLLVLLSCAPGRIGAGSDCIPTRSGKQYPGWPCFLWDTPSALALSFFRVAPADFRPGTRPAHLGPSRLEGECRSLPGGLRVGRRCTGCRGLGWRIVFFLLVGHLRAAMSIASHAGTGAVCCRPNRVPDCFPGAAAGDGRQVHEPLPGSDTGDVAHPLHSRPTGSEVPPDRAGARAPDPAAGTVAPGPFGGAAAWRASGAHGRCAPCPGSSQRPCGPRRREHGGTRRVPRELLKTHSIKTPSSFLCRAGLDGRLPVQA